MNSTLLWSSANIAKTISFLNFRFVLLGGPSVTLWMVLPMVRRVALGIFASQKFLRFNLPSLAFRFRLLWSQRLLECRARQNHPAFSVRLCQRLALLPPRFCGRDVALMLSHDSLPDNGTIYGSKSQQHRNFNC